MVLILYNKSLKKLPADSFADYMKLLPITFQEKISRFYKWEDAQRSLFGNLLLMEAMKQSGFNVSVETTSYTEYLRPWLSNDFDYNISHSGEITVCALSDSNRVGIDVEEISKISPEEFDEQFSEEELGEILKDKSFNYFFKLWTQKEAFLKAIGKGLYVPLNRVSIKNNKIKWQEKEWFLHEIRFNEFYSSHLCIDTELPKIIIREVDFF